MLLQQRKPQQLNDALGCFSQSTASSFKVVILLLSAGEAALGVLCPVWAPQHGRDMGILEGVQQTATETIKEPEHLSYGERLRELGLLSLEKTQE